MRTAVFSIPALFLFLVPASPVSAESEARTDWLTFAQGALPVSVSPLDAKKPIAEALAMEVIDGDPGGFTLVSLASPSGGAELVFELPSLTTFDRFAVPRVLETPSPSQTFLRRVEVSGNLEGPEAEWTLLAQGELSAHSGKDEETELKLMASVPVRFVKLRLTGGLDPQRDSLFLEFSEIVGNGKQERPKLSERFDGTWKGRGVLAELHQEGAVVSGCMDSDGEPFEGTVSGRILRGRSVDPLSGVVSLYVLMVNDDSELLGVRSTNGAPFRHLVAAPAPDGSAARCGAKPTPSLGCESVLHGITFAFDSAEIRPESEPVLAALHAGLQQAAGMSVLIEGHTSSEGSEAYNQGLSERRAAAVVANLTRRGIEASRLSSAGRGESEPIASNDDESGRSMNRRVEVHCSEASSD